MFIFINPALSADPNTWAVAYNPWDETDPDWSYDGSMIAYCDMRNGGSNSDIYVIPAKGGPARPIVSDTSDDREPAWSPDGTEIAYRTNFTGNWDIFVVNVYTGAKRQLTYHPDEDSWPDWSPDGTEIVFSSLRDGERDLYTIPSTGGTPRKIADLPTWDEYPCWSNDNSKIVFSTLIDIYVINTDGNGQEPLIDTGFYENEPFWAPDSRSVVYVAEGTESRDIFVTSYPTGTVTRVTDDDIRDGWPCFSPDGKYIAYSRYSNSWDIVISAVPDNSVKTVSLGVIKAIFK